jgi:hypothetical protein
VHERSDRRRELPTWINADRVASVLHARLVTAQQRRSYAFGHREVDELARACECCAHDLNRLGVFRIGVVDLQIVLGRVGRIRHPAIDKSEFAGERGKPRYLGTRKKVIDLQEHLLLRLGMRQRESYTWFREVPSGRYNSRGRSDRRPRASCPVRIMPGPCPAPSTDRFGGSAR